MVKIQGPRRNLGMDLVRVTEAAALAAGRWVGLGDSEAADEAATQAMFEDLKQLEIKGRIAVGEERKLGFHTLLDSGAEVGTGYGPEMDAAVDPIDGAKLLVDGRSGAISVATVAPAGSMWAPTSAVYMEKLVVDREAAGGLVPECLSAPAAWTLALVARMKGKRVRDLTVFILERPRHEDLVEEIRTAGARVLLRADGDISGALMAASPGSGVDLLMGVGGITEGVIAACAVKTLGGAMLGRLAPQSEDEKLAIAAAGLDSGQVVTSNELISTDQIFMAVTGITDGSLLQGVRYTGNRAETNSIILRGETSTRRLLYAEHLIERD